MRLSDEKVFSSVIVMFFLGTKCGTYKCSNKYTNNQRSTSNLEPGDTEVEVEVTNYNDEMEGYLAVEVGEETDESYVDESTLFTVPELEKGNQIKFYYIDENEKRTLLKNVTVTNPLLPKLTFTNKLYEQSKSIDYKISNYDERFEEGSILQ